MRFTARGAVFSAFLATVLAGCGEGESPVPAGGPAPASPDEPAAPAAPGAEGGATPEEAFEGMKAVLLRKGGTCGELLRWIEPDARASMVFSLWMGVMTGTPNEAMDAFRELMLRHGISGLPAEWGKLGPEQLASKPKMKDFANRVLAGRDLAAVADALFEFKERHVDTGGSTVPPIHGLIDVAVVRDKAQGTVVWTDGTRHRAGFVRVEGRWYVVP